MRAKYQELVIEKDIPMPQTSGEWKYKGKYLAALKKMNPGDSFEFPLSSVSIIKGIAKTLGVTIVVRSNYETKKSRCWYEGIKQQQEQTNETE